MSDTNSTYTRRRLAKAGLTVISASARRGDWVMGPPSTYGLLIGLTRSGSAVVAWARDSFAAKCAAFDEVEKMKDRAVIRSLVRRGYLGSCSVSGCGVRHYHVTAENA